MNNLSLNEAKHYLRVEHTVDDALIESLLLASDQYLKNSGASPSGGEELYQVTQKLLISHWYENREPVGSAAELQQALTPIIFQLKWAGDDTESG